MKQLKCKCKCIMNGPINNSRFNDPIHEIHVWYCFNCGRAFVDSGDGGMWYQHTKLVKEEEHVSY